MNKYSDGWNGKGASGSTDSLLKRSLSLLFIYIKVLNMLLEVTKSEVKNSTDKEPWQRKKSWFVLIPQLEGRKNRRIKKKVRERKISLSKRKS